MHKDEIWQVYAPNGEAIPGEGWDSALGNPEVTGSDKIVGVSVVFLYRFNNDGELELLWQRRAMEVDRYPGDYDISAGGHINLGETVVEGAIRECHEEIGAEITADDLQFAFIKSFGVNRFAWIFMVDWTGRPEEFVFNDKEVSEVKWVPYKETEKFRKKYAKLPLKKDDVVFLDLDDWLKAHGLVSARRTTKNNYAFIDGQNLIYNTARSADNPWKIDLKRLRVYLKEKYKVEVAYYFIGAYNNRYEKMYEALNSYGYEVVFREHSENSKSSKKGNVDTDIVFEAMKKIAEREQFNKILLVSDDGDYWKMVNYFIRKRKFEKILAPSRKNLSLLYKRKIADKYIDYLDKSSIKRKIILKEK